MNRMSKRKKRKLITIISSCVFATFIITFLIIIMLKPSCNKDVDRTNGIYADNFSLNIETKSIEFDYVFNFDRAAIQREINKITKLGVCFHISSGEVYREFPFNYDENKLNYNLSVDDVFEEDYGNIIKLDLYYIYKVDNKELRRFSEEVFELSIYELAKNIEDDYAYDIVSKAENSIVRIDVEYDIEKQELNYNNEKGYSAEAIIENNGGLQLVFKTTGDRKFSEYARIYFNGKVTSDFIIENGVITYITKIAYITNVDIEFDVENYYINNSDHELYKLYLGDLYGADKFFIIVELKDNNVLSKDVLFKLNGTSVGYENLRPGFYYIEVQENAINNLNITLNTASFEFVKDSDNYNIEIGRDEQYEDLAVIISAKEGNKLSKLSNVIINGDVYNLSNSKFKYEDGVITCFVEDDRVSRIDITLNASKYIVTSDSEQYKATMRKPNYLEIIIDINLKYGYEYSRDVALFVNGIKADEKTYIVEGEKIIYTIEDPNWSAPF